NSWEPRRGHRLFLNRRPCATRVTRLAWLLRTVRFPSAIQSRSNGMTRWILGLAAAVAMSATASAQNAVQRGDYLVNTIMTCGNCHSPKGPPAAIAGKDFSGFLEFDEPPFKVTAPNITPDKATGIGGWSASEIKKALIDAVRPNGVPLAPIM